MNPGGSSRVSVIDCITLLYLGSLKLNANVFGLILKEELTSVTFFTRCAEIGHLMNTHSCFLRLAIRILIGTSLQFRGESKFSDRYI